MKRAAFAAAVLMMIMASPAMGQVKFDSVSLDPSHVEPGMDVNIYVKFHEGLTKRNIYEAPSKGNDRVPIGENSNVSYIVRITPKDEATIQYVLIKEGERNVGHLFAGETWTTPFQIHVTENALPINYTLTFEVIRSAIDSNAPGEVILNKDIVIEASGSPKFTLDSDSQLKAGETKEFKVSVGNIGGGVARHVTVNLNATAPLTVLRSSSVYIGDLSGQSIVNVRYDLYTDSAASPKAYSMPVEIKYTDSDGVTQTVNKVLGVKVQGSPQVMASLDSFDDLKGGMSGKVTISVANKGFVEAKFLSLSLMDTDKYTVVSKNSAYIGNLASDDFQSEDFKIMVKDGVQGKIPLKVKVTYTEENNNQAITDDSDVQMNVQTAQEYDKAHPTGNNTQQLMGYLIIVPILIVAYIVLWLLMKIVGAVTSLLDKKIFRKN